MRLYNIRAYDKAEDAEPSRTYPISATSEDEAISIIVSCPPTRSTPYPSTPLSSAAGTQRR